MSFSSFFRNKNKGNSYLFYGMIVSLLASSGVASEVNFNETTNENSSSSELFLTPDPQGHIKIINALNKAQKEIKMMIFHLTDPEVLKALINAQHRGVQVKIILDQKFILVPKYSKPYHQLLDAGIDVVKSSKAFSVSHSKSFVIDEQIAYITSMNLTDGPTYTRDYGVITNDRVVIQDLLNIFATDLVNASSNEGETPNISSPDLVVSPTNSTKKLVALIDSAEHEIFSTVENIDDVDIMNALKRASARQVRVRLLGPLCSEARLFPKANVKRLKELNDAGVETKVMAGKGTPQQAYIHGKMLVADIKSAYLGSENFSENSLKKSREIGLLLHNQIQMATLKVNFESDWNLAIDVNSELPSCN